MSDTRTTQTSFNGGIVSRSLYGRKDLARIPVSLKRAENVLIYATGGAANRAGLRFVDSVKDSSKNVKLTTFEAAGDDAFLLVWGDLNVRPVYQGAYIDAGGGVPYEVVSVYPHDKLDELYMEQSNDVASVVHPDFQIRELSRYAPTDWRFSVVDFNTPVQPPRNVAAAATQGYTDYGSDKLPQPFQYKVASVSADGEESLPSAVVASGNNVLGYEKNYNTITWQAPNTGPAATEYVIYRGRNGIFGSIGRTPDLTFKDTNIEPDFTATPQDGYNPFVGEGNYPGVVSFSQGRRVFSATRNKPQTIYETQSGNYRNMSRSQPVRESDSIEFTLAAERKQDIYHILSIKNGLIVFTRSGEWKVTGRDGNIITPDNQLPEPQSRYGSSKDLRPMVIGESILFADRTKKIVYDMEYDLNIDGYKATDKALLVKDLFKNRNVVAWAYAARPYGVIWCVMDDGTVLSLTYLKEHDVWGWCEHNTKGRFLDVAVVPENGRDVTYFAVERRIGGVWKKYIEVMEDREFAEVESALFMDSALSYDQPFTITAVTPGDETIITVPAHGWTTGDEVDIRNTSFEDLDEKSQGSIDGRYTITVLTADTFKLWHKTIDADWEPGDPLDTTAFTGLYYSRGVVRRCIQSVSGLGHLEGREVVVLGDGFVIDNAQDTPIVVTGGTIPAFDRKYARIHVGLAYRSLIETLDLVNTQADDNGVMKATGPIYARFEQCRGVKVGQKEEDAYELMPRDDEGYYSPPSLMSGIFEIENWGNWDKDIPMHFIQDYPLPMTVLGLTVEYVYGG